MPSLNYLSTSINGIHSEWEKVLLSPEIYPELLKIDKALSDCLQQGKVIYPPCDQIFTALKFCAPSDIKVVILGQDPYHGVQDGVSIYQGSTYIFCNVLVYWTFLLAKALCQLGNGQRAH